MFIDLKSVSKAKLPLRLVLIVPFVLQIFVAVGLTGWISLHNGEKAVNELATRLRQETTKRVAQGLRQYLDSSQAVNRMNEENIRFNHLDLEDPGSLTRTFWKQRFLFDNVCGAAMYFGNSQGEFTGLGLQEDNNWRIGRAGTKSTLGLFHRYATDNQGNATDLLLVLQKFDPRVRPWYQDAVKAGKSVWTRPYPDTIRQEMKVALAQPIYDESGKVRGVIGVDCLLSAIGRFLETVEVGKSGRTFIVDRGGKLIATSLGKIPFKQQLQGIKARDIDNLLIAATANRIGDLSQIQSTMQFDFDFNNQRKLVQVTPFKQKYGLDWLIIVVVPESDFMGTINDNTRITIILCIVALIIATGIGILTSYYLIQPIMRTINAGYALSQGNWFHRIPESRINELALLARAFNRSAEQLKNYFSQLEYNANHDILTGLLNRHAFRIKLCEAIANRQESNTFAVLFLDLDYFKLINDSLGHLAGDELLIEVAKRLNKCLGNTDVISRFGGDEFVILLNQITNVEDVIHIVEQILNVCQQGFTLSNNQVFISASIGIVLNSQGDDNPEDFLRDGDIALYRAKGDGRGKYRLFDSQMHAEVMERLQLEIDLRRAIQNEEFIVYYQPIIDVENQRIIGFEALSRWQQPSGNIIPPSKFIPIAEETGLILKLDTWMLRNACSQMQIWQGQFTLPKDMFISVNLSSRQFLQLDLLEQIEQIFIETGLERHRLKLEITETILMNREEATIDKLLRLRTSGIKLAIDDFGTGYSSLSYLHQFPINTLKIDRSFINRLGQNGENLAIVEAITVLAHKLGMDVIAEGVETTEQLEQLYQIGCRKVQGYLFSPPVDSKGAMELLTKSAS